MIAAPVTPFRGSATERSLRGALGELTTRPDRALVVVCADDLARVLDQIDAYERGAPVGLLRTPTRAWDVEPWWVRRVTDVIVAALVLGFASWALYLWGTR